MYNLTEKQYIGTLIWVWVFKKVDEMKRLALQGYGLNSYIMCNARTDHEFKK